MLSPRRERGLGLGLTAFALFLILLAVPQGVVRPQSVRNIVLSPDFWPQILAWALLAVGLFLTARAFVAPAPAETPDEPAAPAPAGPGFVRLAVLGGVLLFLSFAVDWLGMVWAAMAGFWVLVLATRPQRPWIALGVGVLLPLALYAFFSKFAGVPVPQGDFVRLP